MKDKRSLVSFLMAVSILLLCVFSFTDLIIVKRIISLILLISILLNIKYYNKNNNEEKSIRYRCIILGIPISIYLIINGGF